MRFVLSPNVSSAYSPSSFLWRSLKNSIYPFNFGTFFDFLGCGGRLGLEATADFRLLVVDGFLTGSVDFRLPKAVEFTGMRWTGPAYSERIEVSDGSRSEGSIGNRHTPHSSSGTGSTVVDMRDEEVGPKALARTFFYFVSCWRRSWVGYAAKKFRPWTNFASARRLQTIKVFASENFCTRNLVAAGFLEGVR